MNITDRAELEDREGCEVIGRVAWFEVISAEEFSWIDAMTERGVQLSIIPEDGGLAVYRVNR